MTMNTYILYTFREVRCSVCFEIFVNLNQKKWTFEEMRYSKLIVATGMRPRYLPGQSSGITVYNSSDVERLQELVSGQRVTVVGGSYLGVETAANLVMLKKKNKIESMTLVIGEDHPLSTSYGEMIGKARSSGILYSTLI